MYTYIHLYIYTFIYIYSTVLSSFASSDSPSQRVATVCTLPLLQVSLAKDHNSWRQRDSLEKETSKYREPTTNWWRFVGSWQCQVSFANKHCFCRALLQKSPNHRGSQFSVTTPYSQPDLHTHKNVHLIHIHSYTHYCPSTPQGSHKRDLRTP